MNDMHFAENLIMTCVVVMMLTYAVVAALATWAERPLVIWDRRVGAWRSARLVIREQGRP